MAIISETGCKGVAVCPYCPENAIDLLGYTDAQICGECSETCPTQAEPSEFMAAARRYAIANYDRTGLARTMYTRPVVGTFIAVALAAFFALFMYAGHGPQSAGSLDIFGFIPEQLIHNIGIGVMVVVFAAGLVGVVTMARAVSRDGGVTLRSVVADARHCVARPRPCGAPLPSRRLASGAIAMTAIRTRPRNRGTCGAGSARRSDMTASLPKSHSNTMID